ncbi:MAG TPA: helix-turn-helix transcriptional regulator [Pilimelia sp.]|nr:helix-turn-helix transcriptional regulator [Pilimelia sp.]
MDPGIEKALGLVVKSMRDNLGDQLTVDDMARTAMYSKFHFSRIFQRVTGVSPGRFLSAMRLQQAKQLLVSTTLNVTDIAHRVGYASVGTFSSRFSSSVGVSPTTYRALRGFTPQIAVAPNGGNGTPPSATVRGRISAAPSDGPTLVFVGLFPGRLPQGLPVSCSVLSRPGPYELRDVPRGTWHLLVHSVTAEAATTEAEPDGSNSSLQVGSAGPVTILSDADSWSVDLELRPMGSFDPPVLLALLDVRKEALSREAARRTVDREGADVVT